MLYKAKAYLSSILFREFSLFSSSTVAYQGSNLIVIMIAAKLLGPEIYGLWNLLALIVVYGAYLHLGALDIMSRNIPIYKGMDNKKKMHELLGIGLGITLLVPITVGLVIVFASEIFFTSSPLLRWSLKLMTIYLFLQMLLQYSQRYLKANCQFDKVSYQLFMLAIVLPFITIPLIKLYSLEGLILGQSITILIVLFLTIRYVPFNFHIEFDPKKIFPVVKIGFPIMLLGIAYIFFETVDRWIIVEFLDIRELGYYSLANKAFAFVMLLAAVIGEQIYPRMAEKYGERGDPTYLIPLIFKQIVMTWVVIVPLIITLYVLIPFLIKAFLSEYIPAIGIVNIFLLGAFFFAPALAFSNYLIITDKHIYCLICIIFSIFLNIALSLFFVKVIGLGIKGVALGAIGSYLFISMMLILTSWWILKRRTSIVAKPISERIICLK